MKKFGNFYGGKNKRKWRRPEVEFVFECIHGLLSPDELYSFVETEGFIKRDTFMNRVQKLYGNAKLSLPLRSTEKAMYEIFDWYRSLPSRGERENKLFIEKFRRFLSIEDEVAKPEPFFSAHPNLFLFLETTICSTTSVIVFLLMKKSLS